MNRFRPLAIGAALAFLAGSTLAASPTSPAELQAAWLAEARQSNPALRAFSAERGRSFFSTTHGSDWSCASCHTNNPGQGGSHAVTRKLIEPLAPAANPRRFSDAAKVDKWFGRNCKDVLGRACTPEEKGDLLAYLLTVKP